MSTQLSTRIDSRQAATRSCAGILLRVSRSGFCAIALTPIGAQLGARFRIPRAQSDDQRGSVSMFWKTLRMTSQARACRASIHVLACVSTIVVGCSTDNNGDDESSSTMSDSGTSDDG